MAFSSKDLRLIVTAFNLILWGILFWAVQLNIIFAVMNDLIGVSLITIGVFRLATLEVTPHYRITLKILRVVCILTCIYTCFAKIPPVASFLVLWHLPLGILLVNQLAVVAFCLAISWLCLHLGHPHYQQIWHSSAICWLLFQAAPFALFLGIRAFSDKIHQQILIELSTLELLLRLPALVTLILLPAFLFKTKSMVQRQLRTNLTNLRPMPEPPPSPALAPS